MDELRPIGAIVPTSRQRFELMLPQAWLRRRWLSRVLGNYPVFDPPHKVEEYLLSRAKAQENFDYFMRTRQHRVDFFIQWLRRYFRVSVTLDADGVKALNRWGNKYAGLLQEKDEQGNPTASFLTYEPPWNGRNAGCNALFDMGTTFGEIAIAQLPKLHWALLPTVELLPRRARILKKSAGMSFQRPVLTGWDDPTSEAAVHHVIWGFATSMMRQMTTFQGIARYNQMGKIDRACVRDQLANVFATMLDEPSPASDELAIMRSETPDLYARMIDEQAVKDIGDD